MRKIFITTALALMFLIIGITMASAAYDYTTNFYYQGNPINGVRAINFIATSTQGQTL